ncbi:MAG: flavodoxin-dependent (E)-4-hydroxy-3-methylbut-2-enyl-diphosphate synthase, partial [Lachnospiraceae bacterium]|nr:flavodoxin-dependent (E)-4-hydroxy-3-methylbut-2-enyl-diphosphate synthase [Lachnospiraceae bacterium]
MYREHTKTIKIGNQVIGGGHPVLIQSMTNTKTEDVAATVAQILTLEKAGCQIIRCAVPTMEAALALREIKKQINALKSEKAELQKKYNEIRSQYKANENELLDMVGL